MNTNNMSDEELDNLFRRSAEQYDPPFDEEAWKAMDRKLNNAQGGWAGLKRMLPLVLLALLVTVGIVWDSSNKAIPEPEPEPTAVGREAAQNMLKSSAPENAAGTERASLPASDDLPAVKHAAVQAGSGTVSGSGEFAPHLHGPSPAERIVALDVPLQTVRAELKEQHAVDTVHTVAGIAGIAAPIPADSSQTVSQRERVFLKNITIALVVAPDISTVRFKEPDAVSANAGVLFSVPLTKRLSVVSGAVWANKLYQATPADYAPSPDYWDSKRLPDVIAAQCRVLDIPVNLQYQVLGWGRNKLSVQAGLSSYIMLNEAYTYEYSYNGRGGYSKTHEFSNKNKHWFGVQNLSVGYTHQLSPAFSVGAEPFVKLPLASIGEGRVKLTSAGVFLTAGYTLK